MYTDAAHANNKKIVLEMDYLVVVLGVLAVTGSVTSRSRSPHENLPPIILVPGNGGSQLEARSEHVEPVTSPINSCPEKPEWFTLWVNMYELSECY